MKGTEQQYRQLEEDEMLGFTAAFDEETWESTRGALQYFENGERTHSRYGRVQYSRYSTMHANNMQHHPPSCQLYDPNRCHLS